MWRFEEQSNSNCLKKKSIWLTAKEFCYLLDKQEVIFEMMRWDRTIRDRDEFRIVYHVEKKKLGKKETKIGKCCWSLKLYRYWSPGPCNFGHRSLINPRTAPSSGTLYLWPSLYPLPIPTLGGWCPPVYTGLYLSRKWEFFRNVAFPKISMFSLMWGPLLFFF